MVWVFGSVLLAFIAIVIALYLLPSILAWRLKHHRLGRIIIINICLGWIFLIWIGLVVYLQLEVLHET